MASQPHVPADGVLAAADGFVLSTQGIAQRIGRTIVPMEMPLKDVWQRGFRLKAGLQADVAHEFRQLIPLSLLATIGWCGAKKLAGSVQDQIRRGLFFEFAQLRRRRFLAVEPDRTRASELSI